MSQTYRTLRVARSDEGVLSVVIDAPPMNLIGPELVRDLVSLIGELGSSEDVRVMVLESADPEYFVPHVDLTKVAEYTAEAAKAGGPDPAQRGRDPRRRPPVPPASRLGHRPGPHGRPVHAGSADSWPARTRPRRPPRIPMTEAKRPGQRQSAHLMHKQLSYALVFDASSGMCTPTMTG
jgi:hypothetical protein